MTSTITERTTREPATWVCENCRAETAATRKRCTDCGTSRH